jgi:PAS domain S-box-containing protein
MEEWCDDALPLVGKKCYEAFHGRNAPCEDCSTIDTIATGEATNEKIPKRNSNKEIIGWLDLYSFPMFDPSTKKLTAIIQYLRDVTEKAKTEKELRESERQYKALFDSTNDAIFLISLDGIHLMANEQAAIMLGYEIDELVGLPFRNVVVEDEIHFAEGILKRLLDGETIPVYERTFRRKDGHRIFVEINVALVYDAEGKPLHIQSVVRNISERKRIESELKQKTIDLGERVKELTCLIRTTNLLRNREQSIEEILQKVILEIPPAWQFPEITRARIMVNDKILVSDDFSESEWCLSADIIHSGKKNGSIEIFYLEEKSESDIGPFLKEERVLIDTLARNIGEMYEYRQVEDALRFTQFAVDHSSESAYWLGMDAKFIYVNDATCLDIDPIFPSEKWPDHWEELKGKKSIQIESRLRRKDGSEFPAEITVNYVQFDGNEYNCAFARNITKQISALEEMRGSELKLKMIIESMQDLLFVFDDDDRYSEHFTQSEHLLYRPSSEFLGKHVSEVLPKSVAEPLMEVSKQVRSSGQPDQITYSLTIDNQEKWFEAKLSQHEDIVSVVAVVRDITKRKLAETQIQEQHDFLEKVIESLAHPFYVIDAFDYSIILANHAARLGPLEPGATCYQLTHDSDIPCDGIDYPCPLSEVRRTKKSFIVEHMHVNRNGQARTYLVHGFPIIDEDGEVTQMIEYNLDITDQKNAYDQLTRQKEELSVFAHQMNHDLSNYLLKIDGAIKVLEDEYESSQIKSAQKLISEVRSLLKHSVELADAGQVIEKKGPVSLDILIRDVADVHIPKEIGFNKDSLPRVLADRTKLIQIFQNIFSNAVKHGNPTKISVGYQKTKTGLSLTISNDGETIPTQMKPQILRRWLAPKMNQRGFGLSIVRRIVEAHGWTIELLDSRETTFAIHIPSSEIVE